MEVNNHSISLAFLSLFKSSQSLGKKTGHSGRVAGSRGGKYSAPTSDVTDTLHGTGCPPPCGHDA